MTLYFESLSAIEKLYFICATVGGVFFVVRIILMLLGTIHIGDADGVHVDGDADGFDMDGGHGDIDGMDVDGGHGDIDVVDVDSGHGDIDIVSDANDVHDSDSSFRLLSLQGLTTFFMMFGLVGLALSKQSKVVVLWSMIGAFAGGLLSLWIIAKIFKSMTRLQSDGTMDIRAAIGKQGTVYLTIPAENKGKVQITIQGTLREMPAVSLYKKEIKTGETIEVDSVAGLNTLVVRQI
ncbi:MAG: hypothetical protein GY757_58590 [bacterium]|nr:hypothetical protein [bacterium]